MSQNIIEVKNVRKVFTKLRKKTVILDDVSFSVNASTSEKLEIGLDETQRKALEETLIGLEKKLPAIKEKGQELEQLFLKSEEAYKEVLKHLSFYIINPKINHKKLIQFKQSTKKNK